MKREEAFARINTAKINEQWRTTLRQIKCSELHEDVKNLHKFFEETLNIKDDLIKKLFNELIEADIDHRRFQEAHMMALDNILGDFVLITTFINLFILIIKFDKN